MQFTGYSNVTVIPNLKYFQGPAEFVVTKFESGSDCYLDLRCQKIEI